MEFETESESELTDEYVPGPTQKKLEKTGYRPRNVLKVPLQSTYSAESLYTWISSGYIELEPE